MHIAYYLGLKKDNKETTFLDQLICFATDSRYSHVELIYDWSDVSKIGRCFSSSPRDGGIRGTTINFDSGHWEVYEVETEVTEDHVIQWYNDRYRAKYDWFGAIGSALPPFKQNQNRWFCSESVMACLGYRNPWKYTPQEMFDALKLVQKRVL